MGLWNNRFQISNRTILLSAYLELRSVNLPYCTTIGPSIRNQARLLEIEVENHINSLPNIQ